jgi:hypothetical protein
MRRSAMLALIDATMSDLNEAEPTIFGEDLTEVNLDLSGALESVVEKVTVNHRLRIHSIPSGLVEEISDADLIEEEFSISERTDEEDLPELDADEYVLMPPVDDLVLPVPRSRSKRRVSLVRPEPPRLMAPLARIPLASIPAPVSPVQVLIGKPIIEIHQKSPTPQAPAQPRSAAFTWVVSAIALWAATILSAWALKVQLYEFMGL